MRKRKKSAEPTVERSHRLKLTTEVEHAVYFRKVCGTVRFTQSWVLSEQNNRSNARQRPNLYVLKKEFNPIKYHGFRWLTEIHRDAHADPFNNIGKAWAEYFKDCEDGKSANAQMNKRECRDSFYVASDKFKTDGKEIIVPIVGKVKLTEALRLEVTSDKYNAVCKKDPSKKKIVHFCALSG
ncbi:MAG: hypothetical protein ACLPN1_04720 [Dissulfurispiraceae bacterium]|jgi:putative transposase